MAAASYTTDLTTWQDFEGAAANIVEFNGYTTTNQNREESQDPDNPLQGSLHASIEQRNTGTGSLATNTGGSVTLTSPEVFLIWCNFLQSVAVNTFENDGLVGFLGSSTGNYYRWTIGGSNFGRAPYGGYFNVALDPTISTNGRTLNGTAPTSISVVGFGADVISQINRGSPYNMDVIRYGRGEVIVTDGDLANGYATFSGIAAQNDNNSNRWGLFQEQFGSYLWKGLLNLGSTTSVDFRDASEVIFIDSTLHVASNFNRIEVNGTSSNIDWDNINISTLGITGPTNGTTASRGEFEMVDGATLDFNTCVFTDMNTFIFNKGTGACNLTNTTWRRCRAVTQGGATITGCTFDNTESNATESLISTSSTIGLVTGCTFIRDSGTVNAVAIGGISGTVNIDWDGNTLDTDYGTGVTGNGISSTSGGAIRATFTGDGTLNIGVVNGATIPTVEIVTGGNTVTVNVTASITTTISGVLGNSEIQVLDNPSPYSATSLPAPTATSLATTETVSADTIIGDGTNSVTYSNNGGFVQINAAGTSSFSGVLTDGDLLSTALASGDEVRVTIRDDVDNPTLQLFDEFEVSGTPSASAILTTTTFSSFTSRFGTSLDAANSKTTTVEKVDARYQFSLSVGETIDFLVFRTGSDPIFTTNVTINDAASSSFPISQVGDRNYRDPA